MWIPNPYWFSTYFEFFQENLRLETSDWQAEAFKSLVRAAFEFNSVLKETLVYKLEIVVLFLFKLAHSRKYSFSYLKSYHFHDGTKRSRSTQIRKNLKSISILLEAKPASEVVKMKWLKLNKSRPGPATASSVKKRLHLRFSKSDAWFKASEGCEETCSESRNFNPRLVYL